MLSFKFSVLVFLHLLVKVGLAKSDGVLLIAEFPTGDAKVRRDVRTIASRPTAKTAR